MSKATMNETLQKKVNMRFFTVKTQGVPSKAHKQISWERTKKAQICSKVTHSSPFFSSCREGVRKGSFI